MNCPKCNSNLELDSIGTQSCLCCGYRVEPYNNAGLMKREEPIQGTRCDRNLPLDTNDAGEKLQSVKVTADLRKKYFEDTGVFSSDAEILSYYGIEKVKNVTPDYYGAKCPTCSSKLDPYVVCDAYENIKNSAHHHATKKLLRAGEGHKPLKQDIQEVIDTLTRWQEQLAVDEMEK